MFQQLGGINTVMYFSATILQKAGFKKNLTAILLSALIIQTQFCNEHFKYKLS